MKRKHNAIGSCTHKNSSQKRKQKRLEDNPSTPSHSCLACRKSHLKCSGYPNCSRCTARGLPCYSSTYHETLCERMHLVTRSLAERFLVDLFIPAHILRHTPTTTTSVNHQVCPYTTSNTSQATHQHSMNVSPPHTVLHSDSDSSEKALESDNPLDWFTGECFTLRGCPMLGTNLARPHWDHSSSTCFSESPQQQTPPQSPNTDMFLALSPSNQSDVSNDPLSSVSPSSSSVDSPKHDAPLNPHGSFVTTTPPKTAPHSSCMHHTSSAQTTTTSPHDATIILKNPPPPTLISDVESPEWDNFWRNPKTILPRTGRSIESGQGMIQQHFHTSTPVSMWIVEGSATKRCPVTKRQGKLSRRLLLCNDAFARLVGQPLSHLMENNNTQMDPEKITQEHVQKWLQWMPEDHMEPYFTGNLKVRIGSQYYLQTFERHYNLIFCTHEKISQYDDKLVMNGEVYPATFTTSAPLTTAESQFVVAKLQRILVGLLESCRDKLGSQNVELTKDAWNPSAALKEVSFDALMASLTLEN